jgi:hypothetical protein
MDVISQKGREGKERERERDGERNTGRTKGNRALCSLLITFLPVGCLGDRGYAENSILASDL